MGTEPIANSSFGENVLWPLRISFDLLSEVSHMYPKILGVGRVTPKLPYEKFARQHLAGVLNEHTQQVILLRRKFDIHIPDFDDPPH